VALLDSILSSTEGGGDKKPEKKSVPTPTINRAQNKVMKDAFLFLNSLYTPSTVNAHDLVHDNRVGEKPVKAGNTAAKLIFILILFQVGMN